MIRRYPNRWEKMLIDYTAEIRLISKVINTLRFEEQQKTTIIEKLRESVTKTTIK